MTIFSNFKLWVHFVGILQEAFDSVEEKYREPIPKDLSEKLRLGLQHIAMDVFLPNLYECVLLKMAVKQDPNHEDYNDNQNQP